MVRCRYACLVNFVNFVNCDEFDGVVSRRVWSNNNYVVYNWLKVGML